VAVSDHRQLLGRHRPGGLYAFNEVTFVHELPWLPSPNAVGVVGTFASLHEPIPLRRIPSTPFFTCTLKISLCSSFPRRSR
jgi:hypothetical protein